jgi:peptidoglycan/LPS O-acetylase OafA/YrhL
MMNPNHYRFIDALRGYAILLVMATHASQVSTAWQGIGRKLVDQGARGVQLFFVASALTLIMSWKARNEGAAPFYARRLFRIAPMFWLGTAFFVWLDGFGPRYFAPNGISGFDVLLTALFSHGWHPETITSVVHGGWSIAVEMTFYLAFPLLMFLVRGWLSASLLFIAANVVASYSFDYFWEHRGSLWPGVSDDLASTFLHLWFPTQLPVFATGFLMFYAVRNLRDALAPGWLVAILAAALIAMLALALEPSLANLFHINLYTAFGICFAAFGFCLSGGAARWLVNGPICHLGKVSFSAYLWHFAILGMLTKVAKAGFDPLNMLTEPHGFLYFLGFFPALVLLTTLCSTITYRLIEKPMIRIGNKLIERYRTEKVPHPATT